MTEESRHHHQGHSHSHEDMLSVEDALSRIISCFTALDPEEKPILECLGQILAEDITSPLNLPPLSNSGMDGYAVIWGDIAHSSLQNPTRLKVIGVIPAGQVSIQRVTPGSAIRIMTGAPIPAGADTVIPFEETDEVERRNLGHGLDNININTNLPKGSNIRPSGEDVKKNQLVLESGSIIRSSEISVLASLGLQNVKVIRRPLVSILATGDELVPLDEKLIPGKIYDSNSAGVAASVLAAGGIPKILGIAQDTVQSLNDKLEGITGSDLVITSAGVSKGDYDVVKDVLNDKGNMNFWSVRMRPAKPLAFGHLKDKVGLIPMLGLPGNPVSALVAFEMFARPAIRKMLGLTMLDRPVIEGILTHPIFNADERRVYARVAVSKDNGVYYASPTGPQGSNILTSMSKANGLAICPDDQPCRNAGDKVNIIMLDWNEEVKL